MTLALYGKSGKRKAILVLAAFLALLVATIGGTVLHGNRPVAASTSDPGVDCVTSDSASTSNPGVNCVTNDGHIQIHKYIPKDNPSEGWKQEGASGAEDWRFDLSQGGSVIYNNLEDKLSHDITPGTYRVTEDLTGITGWSLIDIYAPSEGNPDQGNDQCERDGPTGSHTYVDVTIPENGTVHLCAFDRRAPGFVDVYKVVTNVTNDPTLFDAKIDNGSPFTFSEGSHSGAKSAAAGSHVVTELAETGYATLGWATIYGGTACPTQMPTGTGGNVISFGNDNTAEITVASNNTTVICFYNQQDRIINVCKVVDDNGIKPDNEGASFGFDVRVHGSNPFHQTHLSAHEGDASPTCENVSLAAHSIPLNADIEVVEWGDPSGWQNADGYPKNSINGSNGTAPLGTTGTSVTFYDKQATRWITVCKVVEENGDSTKDGGLFKFDVRYGSANPPYPDQGDAEIPAAFEGDPATQDCEKVEVPANKPAEIVEWGLRPSSWGSLSDDAAGYPKSKVGDGPVVSNGTASIPVDQDVVIFFDKRTTRTGTLRIVKNDTVHAADRGANTDGDWDFTIFKGAVPFDTASSAAAEGSTTTAYDKVVPTGNYVVAELDAVVTACGDQTTKTYETRIGTSADPLASTKLVEVTPGGITTVTFNNIDCGAVAGTAEITVTKVIDYNGDRTANGSDYLADGWYVTVDCGPGNVFSANTGDSAGHTAVFPGLPNNTTCTISETAQAGFGSTGWRSTDTGSGSANGAGTSTTLHVDDGDHDTVTFFNQPLVNIHVHKDVVTNAGKQNGAGWKFTLTGCGIPQQEKTTPADGDIDFTGLPAAVGCTYTVTETEQAGWTVSPSAAQTASPTAPGSTANLTFTNMNIITCGIECTPRRLETPTVPPPPPSPSPEVTQVAGERTAGPAIESTPIAPSTGTGTTGGGTPATIVLALAGVAMAGSAFAITIFARKPHR